MIKSSAPSFMTSSSLFSIFHTSLLKEGIMKVTFDKLNGEERTLYVTKCEKYIPKKVMRDLKSKSGENKKSNKSTLLSVWDFDNQCWKSFYDFQIKEVSMF